jgi:hypothetical protein
MKRHAMKHRMIVPAVVLILLSLPVGGAKAQGKGKGNEKAPANGQTAGGKVRGVPPPSEPAFSAQEIAIVQDYFKVHHGSLPPALAEREALPPGLEKQLVKHGKLPPGLKKKVQPLPIELERQLTVLPTGYRRVAIAGDVIVMKPATGLIYDIIRNVIP